MTLRENRRSGCSGRFLIAAVIAVISLAGYYMKSSVNPVTGEKQHVGSITTEQEVALGLQAAPEMIRQFGGEEADRERRSIVEEVGAEVVSNSDAAKSDYKYQFHLLADDETINAFALPGGQIFITDALLKKLKTRGELAGVLGHEVGHVVARHSAEHMAKAQLTQGLTGAAVIATYDPDNPSSSNQAAVAMMIGQLINLKFSRNDELESDTLGVQFMSQAGYDPHALLGVMEVLKQASRGGSSPEFFATHPNPENRETRIKEAIQKVFPNGVPRDLAK
jgi:beta-barrel assembly-enhancing protease